MPLEGRGFLYTLDHEGRQSKDAVWYYPDPKPAAEVVRNRVPFWKDVRVVD